jgi:hypothetical protein
MVRGFGPALCNLVRDLFLSVDAYLEGRSVMSVMESVLARGGGWGFGEDLGPREGRRVEKVR